MHRPWGSTEIVELVDRLQNPKGDEVGLRLAVRNPAARLIVDASVFRTDIALCHLADALGSAPLMVQLDNVDELSHAVSVLEAYFRAHDVRRIGFAYLAFSD